MLKILSIDFDYFQMVDAKIIQTDYPDGVDTSPFVSAVCWSSHYDSDLVKQVTVNEEEINALLRLLEKQTNVKECMIACSHKSIYDFTKPYFQDKKPNLIYNIDMHHDMFNENPKLDCGNWIGHLQKEHPKTAIKWVCNPISETCYGLDKRFQPLLLHSISDITDTDFDLVFLCRSDSWLPPHLDSKFADLSGFLMQALNCPIQYETALDFDRYGACMDMYYQIQNEIKDYIER